MAFAEVDTNRYGSEGRVIAIYVLFEVNRWKNGDFFGWFYGDLTVLWFYGDFHGVPMVILRSFYGYFLVILWCLGVLDFMVFW